MLVINYWRRVLYSPPTNYLTSELPTILKLMAMSPFPDTILSSWPKPLSMTGLACIRQTRERSRCLHSSVLKASLVKVRIEGRNLAKIGGKKIERQVPYLFGRGVRRNPYATATASTRCAAARLRFASGSGFAAGRDEMHEVTKPPRRERDLMANRGTFRHSAPNPDATQGLESSSPLAFHANAPIYIPVAKTRIPAAPVTCERICGST